MKFLTSMLLALSFGLLSWGEGDVWAGKEASSASRIRVQYYPPAIYDQEVATWVVYSSQKQSLTVTLDDKPVPEVTQPIQLVPGPNEINLALPPGSELQLITQQSTRIFHLARPDGEISLQGSPSGLKNEQGLPVILQLSHKHPPKEDRRWQLWNWVSGHWQDNRSTVKSIQSLCAPPKLSAAMTVLGMTAVPLGASSAAQKAQYVQRAYYQLDDIAVRLSALKSASGLNKDQAYVLPLNMADLDAGMTRLQFRMQVEWILARLRVHGARYVFVPSIVRTASQAKRYPRLNKVLRQASLSHDALFTPLPHDSVSGALTPDVYAKSILAGIESIVSREVSP